MTGLERRDSTASGPGRGGDPEVWISGARQIGSAGSGPGWRGAGRTLAVCLGFALACTTYQPFDSVGHLRGQMAAQVGAGSGAALRVPFELDAAILELLRSRYEPHPNERQRVEQVLDLIFERIGLRYAQLPTRDAVETFHAREGNCLSFVNLFVGVARQFRLSPFYVEVTDYQRWDYREGMVVSHGHIVAGMRVAGELKTYDFLPYRPKSYRDFRPIDDLTATAHYYNNLGAEALLRGEFARAEELVRTATRLAPDFVKAINNLGVCLMRRGDMTEADEVLERGLQVEPDNVALLSNLARLRQLRGDVESANQLLARVEGSQQTNPFFFVYQADRLLANGDAGGALETLTEGLRRDTEVPEIHLGLVKVYLALGEVERARHHLGRALRLDATNAEARRYAAMLAREPE